MYTTDENRNSFSVRQPPGWLGPGQQTQWFCLLKIFALRQLSSKIKEKNVGVHTVCLCVHAFDMCETQQCAWNQNAAPWSRLSSKFVMVDIWLGFYSYLNYLSFKHDEYFMYLEKNPWNSLKKATESCFQLRQLPGNFWDSGNYRAHKIRKDTDQSGHWVFE